MLVRLVVAAFLVLGLQEPTSTPPEPGEATPSMRTSPRTKDGQQIKEPKKTKYVAPEWPANALRAGLNGTVILECVIGTDGRVQNVRTLKGYRSLAEAGSEAVRKWRYTTTELDGKAVSVIMTVTVNFRLRTPPKRGDALASLTDPDPEIRWAAMKWLGRYRPITADQKAAIEAGLQDSSELVRNAAKEALQKLAE